MAAHPDTLAAQATLKDIAAERNCSNAPPWALEDRAELRSDLVGNFPRVSERRVSSFEKQEQTHEHYH